jgi:hypothetical protein
MERNPEKRSLGGAMEQVEPKKWQNLPERVTFDQMTTSQPAPDAPDAGWGATPGSHSCTPCYDRML